MKKTKKMNNKGFSLVELIIVVAIMVVLVGVLAPQYMKYVDRSKAGVDQQYADNIRSAMQTCMLDPNITQGTDVVKGTETAVPKPQTTATDKDFWKNVYGILGVATDVDLKTKLKLDATQSIKYKIDSTSGKITITISGGKYSGVNEIKVE